MTLAQRGMRRWARFGVLALLACCLQARAEGNVRVLACSLERVCDAVGACEAAAGDWTFTMEPREIADDGAGEYLLRYADTEVTMTSQSWAGPFLWRSGGEQHTLLANTEMRFLWHRLPMTASPQAELRHLSCGFRQ